MAESEVGASEAAATRRRARYFQRLRIALVTTLTLILVVLAVAGWALHPTSSGFQPVPQHLTIYVSGSRFDLTETLQRSSDGTTELQVSSAGGARYAPLAANSFVTMEYGPTAAGAVAVSRLPVARLGGKALANDSWRFIVVDPGGALPCSQYAAYRRGTVQLPLQPPAPAIVVGPTTQPAGYMVGDSAARPGICLRWTSGSPVNLSGPYLSARFPPVRETDLFTQVPQYGDTGAGTIARIYDLAGGDTANYNIQSDPRPDLTTPVAWRWNTKDTPQTVQLAATNATDAQRESNYAFYSGILFGIAGGALIALITELVLPLTRRGSAVGED